MSGMRNFWASMDCTGRSTVATGPRAKDGELAWRLSVKQDGQSTSALYVRAFRNRGGELVVLVGDGSGKTVYERAYKEDK